jgi:hypothetical protein
MISESLAPLLANLAVSVRVNVVPDHDETNPTHCDVVLSNTLSPGNT